jgi:cytochrome c-type biogenesis protein
MTSPFVWYVFGAGMLASINPCGFAMLPAYLSYFLATEDSPTADGHKAVKARLPNALLIAGVCTSGFMAVFLAAGAAISAGAYVLVRAMPIFGLIVGLALVVLGVLLLSGLQIAIPGLHLRFVRKRTLGAIFVFGVAYALASLSCTLPIFLVAVGSTFMHGGLVQGVVQFLSYALGMGLVLAVATVSLALAKGAVVRWLKGLVRFVERAGAVLVIGAGGYIVYYWLTSGQLSAFFAGNH